MGTVHLLYSKLIPHKKYFKVSSRNYFKEFKIKIKLLNQSINCIVK